MRIFGRWRKPRAVESKVSPASGSVVLGTVEQSYGVRLTTSFKDQLDVFNKDPIIRESVNQFAQEVISTGIFTTANEKYTVKLPNGPNGNWTAKECVDQWNKERNLDNKVLQIAVELVAFGNSFWNKELLGIPIQAIDRALPKSKLVTIREKYNLKTTGYYGMKTIPFGTFVHFATHPTGYAPFGSGIMLGIVASPDNNVPSLWEIRKSLRKSMKEGFEKFSFGNELWVFDGLADDKIEKLGKEIVAMKSTGQRIATNVKGNIQLAVPQRTQSYDKWIDQTHHEFLMALANPSLKLGLEQGFTKSTAEAAREMFAYKIESIRRVIKREIEALWVTVLQGYGFDGEKAEVKLHFGSQEIEYETIDLFRAVELQLITKDEARLILRENMKWRLEETLPEQPPEPKEELKEAKEKIPSEIKHGGKVLHEHVQKAPFKHEPLTGEITGKLKTDELKVSPLEVKQTLTHETSEELVAEKIKTEKQKQSLMKKAGKSRGR